MIKTKIAPAILVLSALGIGNASADVVRCVVSDRSHRLMPEWIEYEIDGRGMVLEVRDSVGETMGIGWVRGEISENTSKRLAIQWSNGPMPKQVDWWANGSVSMRLAVIPDGKVLVTGIPDHPLRGSERYNGTANCAPA